MKTLYFEAAGCYILHNDVESGRIRTAFTNRDGKKVYIELICGYGYMFCDSCHYITDDPKINDCMESRLPCERNLYIKKVRYTKENITNNIRSNNQEGRSKKGSEIHFVFQKNYKRSQNIWKRPIIQLMTNPILQSET